MRPLGWYFRLCLILSVWWLAIGTVWFFERDTGQARGFDEMIWRICSNTAGKVMEFDVPKGMAEDKRCTDELTDKANKRAAKVSTYWSDAFGTAALYNVAALIVALAGYWSVRFILAGRRNNRNSVLTKDTDIR